MAIYGLDFYSQSKYGIDVKVEYSVEPMTAMVLDDGSAAISWTPPSADDYTDMRLVRNPYGIPGDADDGDVIYESPSAGVVANFLDTDLTRNHYYFYGVFLAAPFDAWQPQQGYKPGDKVTYEDLNYQCIKTTSAIDDLVSGNPAAATSNWVRLVDEGSQWVLAGTCATLSIPDLKIAERMYSQMPQPYRILNDEITSMEDGFSNQQLLKFLAVFGYEMTIGTTQTLNLSRIFDTDWCNWPSLELQAQRFSLERPVSNQPYLYRRRVKHAPEVMRHRGEKDALERTLWDMTGWRCRITDSTNLMTDQDQSGSWYPYIEEWQRGHHYETGDYVSYGGLIYKSRLAQQTFHAPDLMPAYDIVGTTADTPVVREQTYASVWSGRHVLGQKLGVGGGFTLAVDLPATAVYNVIGYYSAHPNYGIWTTEIDGELVNTFDAYATRMTQKQVKFDRLTLEAGTHELRFTVTGKNAAASDLREIGVAGFLFSPVSEQVTEQIPPSGHPDSGDVWQLVEPPVNAAGKYLNPTTLDVSTWCLNDLSTNARLSGLETRPAVTHDDFATTVYDFNGSAGQQLAMRSIAPMVSREWDDTIKYDIQSLVSHDDKQWRAIANSYSGYEPGHRTDTWRETNVTLSSARLDPEVVYCFGTPMPRTPVWNEATSYARGETVNYDRYRYSAIVAAEGANEAPSGDTSDNTWWAYNGQSQDIVTASFDGRINGGDLTDTEAKLRWYGTDTTFVGASLSVHSDSLISRFDVPYDDIAGKPVGTNGDVVWQTVGTWTAGDGHLSCLSPDEDQYVQAAYYTPPDPPDGSTAKGTCVSVTWGSDPQYADAQQGAMVGFDVGWEADDFGVPQGIGWFVTRNEVYWMRREGALPDMSLELQTSFTEGFASGERMTIVVDDQAKKMTVYKLSGPGYQRTAVGSFTWESSAYSLGLQVGMMEIRGITEYQGS
ncbi:hypothetical protein [Streptomyces sp. NBC_00470]|uniref:hypothetical protein n=1 Tax=Streptomyces sp. NBC_00470 TaxID=2975753 RepID=UPI0030DF7088